MTFTVIVNKNDSYQAFEELQNAVKKGAKAVIADVGWALVLSVG